MNISFIKNTFFLFQHLNNKNSSCLRVKVVHKLLRKGIDLDVMYKVCRDNQWEIWTAQDGQIVTSRYHNKRNRYLISIYENIIVSLTNCYFYRISKLDVDQTSMLTFHFKTENQYITIFHYKNAKKRNKCRSLMQLLFKDLNTGIISLIYMNGAK